ncbi:unnamed protein product [Prorocentrum cordatum]|uniref:Uncharacterized protein n=1 Tax=Prorocentrum cordatum TaxID=2364126 RepID=A0ABN9VVH0_9DINO|nr:unnamed protein product [Polarella glacialis]
MKPPKRGSRRPSGKVVRQQPKRFFRQQGDFPVYQKPYPVALRPAEPPATRDLQDSALDAEAAEGFGDRARKVKPHLVRQALAPPAAPGRAGPGDMAKVRYLREQRLAEPRVADFDAARDVGEEFAAELEDAKAKARARRNYKWMPNPYGERPGALGTDPKAQARYYDKYFDGQRLEEDRRAAPGPDGEDLREGGRPPPRRPRVSPRQFWYKPDYVTPDPHMVPLMTSKELKFAMVNEAHLVRRWRASQPEGKASGLPHGSKEVWMAFGHRAAELAKGRELAVPDHPKQKLLQRCSNCTALRFLQAVGHVQAGPYSALLVLVTRVLEHLQELKPQQCFYFLQAMSRLRLKHPKAALVLERMSLAWRTLEHKMLVKAANAVAKLDLGSHLWARPLKLALSGAIPHMKGEHLANLKAIAVMELLGEPEAMRGYLEKSMETRGQRA